MRVIYDWMGGFGKTSRTFWRRLRAGGVEVRCYNPPRSRARSAGSAATTARCSAVDGRVGFVTGLCVGQAWVGDAARKHRAVARYRGRDARPRGRGRSTRRSRRSGRLMGAPLPDDAATGAEPIARRATFACAIVATVPNTAGLFRLGSARRRARAQSAVADRRLLRRDARLRAGAAGGRAGRRGRAAARPERHRHSLAPAAVARRLSHAAGGGRARLRVERHDAARQDGRRRRPLGARRLDEPEPRELARQLRARRRRRGRDVRPRRWRRCTSRT